MTRDVEIDVQKIVAQVHDTSDEALLRAAFRIEAGAKTRIVENNQIDTGFMLNSIYVSWRDGSGYSAAKTEAEGHATSRRTGARTSTFDRMAPELIEPRRGVVAVVVGARYAIFQELRRSFLWAAAQEVEGA